MRALPGHDPRYAKLTEAELPQTESLALTIDRVVPYWTHSARLARIIAAAWTTWEDEILELNIPTGVPLVYEFDENFKPVKHYSWVTPTKSLQKRQPDIS
ncbi:2,3-bisphosphoglycerate-dependent phosphoglycerate mutase family protein [Enterobacter hormaechei subsp. xiangfangensis]|nr:2,3-bisphosphoglycerate-dependent phosphoglycerate mutase family protein [Enterobacter hormaechei subsp. xiangfangensis]